MVVGAGRGGILSRVLAASESTGRPVRVYAIEKNPSAVTVLTAAFGASVTIVHTDMRVWNPPEQAGLVVSELLGSFGDNELSPECLDSALKTCLLPGGVCIPESYTSYIRPVSSSKLVHEVMRIGEKWDTAYVVQVNKAVSLADTQKCFSFSHAAAKTYPSAGESGFNLHNDRFTNLKFEIKSDSRLVSVYGILTIQLGFVGYFSAKLYGTVEISTLPSAHTPGMYSWFPVFFPLRDFGHRVFTGDVCELCMWRRSDSSRVWYEWCVGILQGGSKEKRVDGMVHNPGGEESFIGLV